MATPAYACDCGKFLQYRGIPTHRNKCQERIRKIKLQVHVFDIVNLVFALTFIQNAQDVTFTANGPSPLKSSSIFIPSSSPTEEIASSTRLTEGSASSTSPTERGSRSPSLTEGGLRLPSPTEGGASLTSLTEGHVDRSKDSTASSTNIRSRLRSQKSVPPPTQSDVKAGPNLSVVQPSDMATEPAGVSSKPAFDECKFGCGKVGLNICTIKRCGSKIYQKQNLTIYIFASPPFIYNGTD